MRSPDSIFEAESGEACGAGPKGIDKMKLDIVRLMAFVGMGAEPKKKEKRREEEGEARP